MKQFLLLMGNEDGEPVSWLANPDEVLSDPLSYGITKFITDTNTDPAHWGDGEAMLLEVKVLKPVIKATAYMLNE